jgi:hypothetical protein
MGVRIINTRQLNRQADPLQPSVDGSRRFDAVPDGL